jgi:Protein of unknown function (DUF295)
MDYWSSIPEHLVEKFAEMNDNHTDFLSFGAVCKSWRCVFKNNIDRLPSKFPVSHCLPRGRPFPLLLKHTSADAKIHSLFSFSTDKIEKVPLELDLSVTENNWIAGSYQGFLLMIKKVTHELTLINPLTGSTVRLPPFFPWSSFLGMKIVFYMDPTANTDGRMVVFVCTYTYVYSCSVGDQEWKFLKLPVRILDFINYNGLVYAINMMSDIYVITLKKETIEIQSVSVWKPRYWFRMQNTRKYLVQSSGELLLVQVEKLENFTDTPCIMIFKLKARYDTENCKVERYEWEMVNDVGNMMIFLGHKGSLSVDSSLHPGTRGNCVYFHDVIYGQPHMAVYYLSSKSLKFFSLDVAKNIKESLWFSPNL